jgi:hypothetical protein
MSSSLAHHIAPVDMCEIQMTTASQLTAETSGNRHGGVASRSEIEANAIDGQGTYGASSGRSKVQLTATLLALFVRGLSSNLPYRSRVRTMLTSSIVALVVSRCLGLFNCYHRNPDYHK